MAERFILALESSTDKTTVALGNNSGAIGQEEIISNRYSEKIVQLIDDLLKKQDVKLNEIRGFIAGTGPGSFTGVRAGISTIRALAQALHKPAAGIPSTLAVARSLAIEGIIKQDCNVLVALDAKRSDIYVCLYKYFKNNDAFNEIFCKLVKIDEFREITTAQKNTILIGPALNVIPLDKNINYAPEQFWEPQAKYLFSSGMDFGKLSCRDVFSVKPLYWRPSDAVPI